MQPVVTTGHSLPLGSALMSPWSRPVESELDGLESLRKRRLNVSHLMDVLFLEKQMTSDS